MHCFGGTWGLLAVGLLAEPTRVLQAYGTDSHPGFFYTLAGSVDAKLLACQIIGILFVVGWTLITMFPFFIWLNFMGWFRSGSIQELVGLDITYNLDGGVGADGQTYKGEGGDEDAGSYVDVYEKYRATMYEKRQKHERRREEDSDMDLGSANEEQ